MSERVGGRPFVGARRDTTSAERRRLACDYRPAVEHSDRAGWSTISRVPLRRASSKRGVCRATSRPFAPRAVPVLLLTIGSDYSLDRVDDPSYRGGVAFCHTAVAVIVALFGDRCRRGTGIRAAFARRVLVFAGGLRLDSMATDTCRIAPDDTSRRTLLPPSR